MADHLFPWRAPQNDGWLEEFRALRILLKNTVEIDEQHEHRLRALANQQLSFAENAGLAGLCATLSQVAAPRYLQPVNIGLISNATLDFFARDLGPVCLARGLLPRVHSFPFGAVRSVTDGSYRHEPPFPLDVVLLMLTADHFSTTGVLLSDADEVDRLDIAIAEIVHLADGVRATYGATPIVATSAIPPTCQLTSGDLTVAGTAARFLDRLNRRIIDEARDGSWQLWDMASAANDIGAAHWYDPAGYFHGKTLFSGTASVQFADHLSRLLAAMSGMSARCVIFDLDNVLWGGVIGDDGPDGVELGQGTPAGEAFLAVQRLALQLRERGLLLAVCSKNTEATAIDMVENHPEMLLRKAHFSAFEANWSDKATNIRNIASQLDLGLSSMLFIDDNPAERDWVRRALPEVMVPELGDDPAAYPLQIIGSGYLEQMPLTQEDASRAESYAARARHHAVKQSGGNYKDYLKSLDMELAITPFDAVGRRRISHLINKSNQFNLRTRRYNEQQVQEIEQSDRHIGWQVRLKDRLADHGMIAVAIMTRDGKTLFLDSFLMSCRVLERGVEQQVMNAIVSYAKANGFETLAGEYIKTAKNGLVADLLERLGFAVTHRDNNGSKSYRLDVPASTPLPSMVTIGRIKHH